MAHTRCMLEKQGYIHVRSCTSARVPTRTHRPISNNYFFSTATIIHKRASLLRYSTPSALFIVFPLCIWSSFQYGKVSEALPPIYTLQTEQLPLKRWLTSYNNVQPHTQETIFIIMFNYVFWQWTLILEVRLVQNWQPALCLLDCDNTAHS